MLHRLCVDASCSMTSISSHCRSGRCGVCAAGLSIIFQEATASLDPLTTVGSQIAEAYALHHRVSRSQARTKAKDLLVAVGIPYSARRLGRFSFELSAGMCQPIMFTIRSICAPLVLAA